MKLLLAIRRKKRYKSNDNSEEKAYGRNCSRIKNAFYKLFIFSIIRNLQAGPII